MSARLVVASDETTMIVPAAAAARAMPPSPSSCAIRWIATGATSTGIETGVRSTVVAALVSLTSTSTRGRSAQRRQPSTLSARAHSSSAPPAK